MTTANFNSLTAGFSVQFKLDELPLEQRKMILMKLLQDTGIRDIIFDPATPEEVRLKIDLAWEKYFRPTT